jgi:midasin (ATPase involved in ribosome maturation)
MYEDFRLTKLFGDKTIINGSIVFQESNFVKSIQGPSLVLFDEINALSNANTFDFHALLQNRELFIKDANNGMGNTYRLHNDCKIGFAQNPKSAKYIGGNIKASNFLGRCTYLTFPEFTKKEIRLALRKKFPALVKEDLEKFVAFYFATIETIEKASVPVDVSIRQLNNVIDLWNHGMPIQYAIEDGLTSVMESISQPKAKETFFRLAQAVWKELLPQSAKEKVEKEEKDEE